MKSFFNFFIFYFLFFIFFLSCTSSGSKSDATIVEDIPETDAASEEMTDICGLPDISYDGEVVMNENFRILYGYRGRIIGPPPEGNSDKHDLWLMDPSKPKEAINLTQFGLKETGYNCNLGCIIDSSIHWIALTVSEASEKGFDFILGKFNDKLAVSIVKGEELKEKADYIFDHDVLYYSEQMTCTGNPPSCQYDIYKITFDPMKKEKILTFPPIDDLKDSVYKGHLHLGMDGKTLIFLNPTIRSQTVYVFKEGKLIKVDYICPTIGEGGQCIGAGSYYSDNDPVNLAPDGENIAAFFLEENEYRLRLYNLKTDAKKYSVMVAVPKDYAVNACYNKKEWQYTQVVDKPVFTPDSQEVIFIGKAQCYGTKPWTNIIRLKTADIGDGTPLEECEFRKITNNPKEDSAWNINIRSIEISPEGKWIVFTGTPTWQVDGNLITAASLRHFNDNEVWMVSIDGGKALQLTNNMDFEAKMIKAVLPP
jgi:hypothetical protein